MTGLPRVNISVVGAIDRPGLFVDGIAGFVFYNDNIADLTTFLSTNRIIKFTKLSDVEATGITAASTNFKTEHYQISEFFRLGGGTIYIGIFDVPVGAYDYAEITTMKTFSKGEIKLYALATEDTFAVSEVAKINTILTGFDTLKQSAYALFSADFATIALSALPDLRGLASDAPFVSVVLGQDTENYPLTVVGDSITNLGATLGALSTAKVNENILNTGKFNYTDGSEMAKPGFYLYDGVLLASRMYEVNTVADTDLNTLNDHGYIFWRYFANLEGSYLSNDNNSVAITETFNSIHIVRTRNKVIREVDGAMATLIGATVLFNEDGTIRPASAKVYEDAVGSVLSPMVDGSEISAFSAKVDLSVNTLSTKEIVINIAIIPTESADYITINIEFTQSI